MLELLTEEIQAILWGVCASDESLAASKVASTLRSIPQIYDTCRQPEQIEAAFNALQAELEEVIAERIKHTQTQLLENFDEDVHDRLKLRLDEAEARLDKLSRWFWGVSPSTHWMAARASTSNPTLSP